MFILPLMVILLGIEFYLVFERTTQTYEKHLTEGYTMLVVSKKPIKLTHLQKLNPHITKAKEVKRESIVKKVGEGLSSSNSKEIVSALPYFYDIGLDAYLHTQELEKIKLDLEKDNNIKRVETFGSTYNSSYKLFSLVKFILKIFIFFMSIVSLFLIVKQMEIWKYTHKERMQIMEIFGAPMMLRAGVLFRVALTDAIFATLFVGAMLYYVKFYWAPQSGIDVIMHNKERLFATEDMAILFTSSLVIVILAVYWVVSSNKRDVE